MTQPIWDTGCPDWQERIKDGRSLISFPPLFQGEADAAMDVFRSLNVVDVAGSPTFAECSRPWSLDFAEAIFGAYDPIAARRLIREFFLLISKKNAKSTNAAGIMLTALIRNWRQSAEFLIVAPTLEVATNSFYPARDMVKADPELNEILHVRENLKTIEHRTTGATLKVIAADNETVSGKKATGVLIDELWLFGKRANAENMLREATGGLISRPEGFVVYLSTQSDEPPAGVFKQKLNYFRKVRDGEVVDKRSLPLLFEFPPDMLESKAFMEPENWHITNPNLGSGVDELYLADELRKAEDSGPQSLNVFLSKHLNIEIGQSLRNDRWAGADFWQGAIEPEPLTLESLLDRCEVACVGVDGGGLDDLFSLAVVGRELGTGRWLAWQKSWCQGSVLDRRKSEASRLRDFEADGDLIILDKLGNDIAEAVAIIKQVDDAGVLAKVGMDPYGVGAVVDALAQINIGGDRVVAVPQGYKLMGAIKTTERKLADGTLFHGGQPIMAWAVGNAKVEQKGNAILITKQASGVAKIDPLMALFDAVALMSENPETVASVYTADRGIVVFG